MGKPFDSWEEILKPSWAIGGCPLSQSGSMLPKRVHLADGGLVTETQNSMSMVGMREIPGGRLVKLD